MRKIKKVVFVSESIRRDSHAPLRYFDRYKAYHLYLKSPYGDMDKDDFSGAKQVDINNLYAEIIDINPDIIQGTEPFGSRLSLKLSNICLKAKKELGAKLVVPILENRPIPERFSLLQRAVLKFFCPRYFKACDAIIAVNKGAIKNIKYYYQNANIITGIVWGVWGVDLKTFKPMGEKTPFEILYVGRIIEDKGLRYLFRGFKKAIEKIPQLKLKIVGMGDLRGELEEYAKQNGFLDKVVFTGLVKNRQLPKLFAQAELCAYPSITMKRWEEQVGTVNFQALACGTPVLTTKSGAIGEYIKEGEGAMLVNEKNSGAIAKAIITFFSNKALKSKLTCSSRQAVKKYDIKVNIQKAQELFDEIIEGN